MFGQLYSADVTAHYIAGDYEVVPANGAMHVTITHLGQIGAKGDLLTALRDGRWVWLNARTGRRQVLSAPVIDHWGA